MMRLTSLFSAIVLAPLLLFGVSSQYLAFDTHARHQMVQGTEDLRECLGSCSNRTSPIETAISNRDVESDKEPDELPADSEVPQFIGFVTTGPLISSAFFLRHLRWRPPDLYKLNALFRI